ncbi:hypothetical protein ACFWY9_40780 [Amycolatopsis sp. NPDC059027]|uniref:hypothetical protein n=1 Tax=Amycolatopsis sp. NPDC059027 TaxID=3346709 RepID=UPI003672A3F9
MTADLAGVFESPVLNNVLAGASIAAVLAVLAVIMLDRNRGARKAAVEHWFRAFAAEHGGTFHSGQSGDTAVPSFGVRHPGGRPLGESSGHPWVEFRHRDRAVIGADGRELYRALSDHIESRDQHYVQVSVPPSPLLCVGKVLPAEIRDRSTRFKTMDKAFDAAYVVYTSDVAVADEVLDAELRAWLLRSLGERSFAVEGGSLRTWGVGQLSRPTLIAEADFLLGLADHLPARLWRAA